MDGKGNGYDLAVVGAGVIGLSCAWRAAQAGLDVVVLERDEPGAGASGVAAGMLAPVTEAEFGEEELLALNLESRGLWPGFAAELEELTGLPTGYAESGALVVAADRDDAEELRRLHHLQQRLGLETRVAGPARGAAAGARAVAMDHRSDLRAGDAAVDPGAVVRPCARRSRTPAAQLRVETEAKAVAADGGRVTGVRLAGGETVRRDAVLMATGAWSAQGELGFEAAAPEVRPVKGQLLELRVRRGQEPPARRLIRTPRCYVVCRRGRRGGCGRHDGGAGLRHRDHRRRRCPGCWRRRTRCCPTPPSWSWCMPTRGCARSRPTAGR